MQTLVDVTKGWYQKEAYTIHTLRHHEERNRRIWQVIRIVLLENKIKEMDHFYTNVWIRYGFYKWCYHFRFEWQQIFPKIVCLVSFWLELNQIFDITIYETKAITFFSSILTEEISFQIWLHLLKKSLLENLIFCAVPLPHPK